VNKSVPTGLRSRAARAALLASTALVALTVVALAGAASAAAQTYTVSNVANTGAGSLRTAVEESNALAGPDKIVFTPGLGGTIQLSGTGLTIKESLTIEGPADEQIPIEQTTPGHRVFAIDEMPLPGAVTFIGLDIYEGHWKDGGGDIDAYHSNAALTIERCSLLAASTEGESEYGGALVAEGEPLIVRDSEFDHDEAGSGGAIWAGGEAGDTVTIEGSTFYDDTATDGDGGAILLELQEGGQSQIVDSSFIADHSTERGGALFVSSSSGSTLAVGNSTFTGNGAGREGGAIVAEGDDLSDSIEGSTIVGNQVTKAGGEGGGVYASDIQPLTDSIVADNSASVGPDVDRKWVTAFDLIGNPAGGELTESTPGSDLLGVEPQLGPLADNGGPTETMAPAVTSPAVNKGGGSLTTDQRGDPRPVIYPGIATSSALGANGADIGAVELQAPPGTGGSSPAAGSSPPPPPSGPTAKVAPRVLLTCPKTARPGGCRFALEVVSGKPRHVKGRGGRTHLVALTLESAPVTAKVAAGKSALVTLTPKAKFAARLDAASTLLVRQVETVKGKKTTSYRRLKVVR
jgi:hypothetical protein